MTEKATKIELLAPAGSPEALDAAVGEGADAVYLGLKSFNARMRSANFTYSQFEGALRSLRRMGKKLYVTVNTVFEQREADRMYQLLKYLAAFGPDALIVQDFGVISMVRSQFPSLRLHASTQMNIASGRGANALSKYGVSRVVLARELSLKELRGVRQETNLELEVFVHGALCISASGLCLFSSYLGGKSANRGLCTQACRRLYFREDRPGQGGYYFSPADLQLLERLPDLAAAGINALKIEGRMKSADYVGVVVSAYRLVLDAIAGGDEGEILASIRQGREILRNDFARSKTQFYFDARTGNAGNGALPPNPASPDWLNPDQDGGTGINLGTILKVKGRDEDSRALVSGDGGLLPRLGDSVRLHSKDDTNRVSHKLKFVEPADGGLAGGLAGGLTCGFWISVPAGFKIGDRVYLIQTKTMSKRYAPVIERNTPVRGPGRERAPFPDLGDFAKTGKSAKQAKASGLCPEGLYVAVSRTEDLFIVQSSRPQRVMLSYSRKTAAYLLAENKPPLPFKPTEIILVLDPYLPEGAVSAGEETGGETLEGEIDRLVEKGYRQFVLNNPGHFSLFRILKNRDKALLIAGPWLYIFNAWSLSFVLSMGVDGCISPLENNRQNLERTLGELPHSTGRQKAKARQAPGTLRSRFFIPVFAWPPLFRIRSDLGPVYDFNSFTDNMGGNFSIVSGPEGSQVYPENPFSITDKIPFLREAGFSRFIIDLSGPPLKKAFYRDLMRAVNEGAPISGATRFNWKDGFYQKP
jgi:U32 family peptidase